MQIVPLSRDSRDFYRLMGPIFGSREIAKEIGVNVYDDADKEWFIMLTERGVIAGLASLRGSIISDCYVKPDYRGKGILAKLLARLLLEPRSTYRANCTDASLATFLAAGFTTVSTSKNFTRVIKHA